MLRFTLIWLIVANTIVMAQDAAAYNVRVRELVTEKYENEQQINDINYDITAVRSQLGKSPDNQILLQRLEDLLDKRRSISANLTEVYTQLGQLKASLEELKSGSGNNR